MSAILQQQNNEYSVQKEIQSHKTWLGRISGLKAEKLLRGLKTPYLYVLRAGENAGDYYITYIRPDFSIFHQPLEVTETIEGWYIENTAGLGPFINVSIEEVLHIVMHCEKGAPTPFVKE